MENPLLRVPGLGGYLGAQQFDQQNQFAQLRNLHTLSALQEAFRAQEERMGAAREQQALQETLRGAANPQDAISRLMRSGNPAAIGLAAKLNEMTRGQPIGAGGLMLPDRTVVPPANNPRPQNPSNLARLLEERDKLPPESPLRAHYDNAIRKESETARQISPTVVNNQPAPVTTVVVQDKTSPTGWSYKDARTGRVTAQGAPAPSGSQERLEVAANVKRQIANQGVGDAITSARNLLTGRGGEELPTGSGVGAVLDTVAGVVGYTPPGAKSAEKLRVVGGSLVQKVPRFEGPQSDKDVAYYKEVAGRIGDATLPIERRLAALDEVENIWGQYEAGKKHGFFTMTPGNTAGGRIQPPASGWKDL